MTKQEIFDKVASHLLTQRERSASDNGACLYRGPRGLKCAAGFLIPDDIYTVDMEGENAEFVFTHFFKLSAFREHVTLVLRLQAIHDNFGVDLWKDKLETLAKYEGISYDILKQF